MLEIQRKKIFDFLIIVPLSMQGQLKSVQYGSFTAWSLSNDDYTVHNFVSATDYGVPFPDTGSGKQAMEGDCSSPPFTCGDIFSEDSFEDMHTSKQKQKAETSNPFSGKGPGANDSSFIDPCHTQVLESHGPLGTSDHSLGFDSANFGPGPQHNMPVHKVQLQKMQQIGPGHFPTSHSPMQPRSYDKAGYSVVISSGALCHSSDEMGIVVMESGTQFCIAIANNNNYGELLELIVMIPSSSEA